MVRPLVSKDRVTWAGVPPDSELRSSHGSLTVADHVMGEPDVEKSRTASETGVPVIPEAMTRLGEARIGEVKKLQTGPGSGCEPLTTSTLQKYAASVPRSSGGLKTRLGSTTRPR